MRACDEWRQTPDHAHAWLIAVSGSTAAVHPLTSWKQVSVRCKLVTQELRNLDPEVCMRGAICSRMVSFLITDAKTLPFNFYQILPGLLSSFLLNFCCAAVRLGRACFASLCRPRQRSSKPRVAPPKLTAPGRRPMGPANPRSNPSAHPLDPRSRLGSGPRRPHFRR